ncbi:MAG: hypothetical protein K6B68_14925 [Eubacterium sp.]|nr:hypothetical protein [Eubacterium sp.]
MEKRKKYHDFYLCDIEPEEGSGYMVKQVNSEGKVVFESYMSFEDFDYWNGNKDYVRVSRSEWEEIGKKN